MLWQRFARRDRGVLGNWGAAVLCIAALGPHPVAHCHCDVVQQPGGVHLLVAHLQLSHGGRVGEDLPPADSVHFHWEFASAVPLTGASASSHPGAILPSAQVSAFARDVVELSPWPSAAERIDSVRLGGFPRAPGERAAPMQAVRSGRVRCIQKCAFLC